jgi:hypothetical protein
MKQEQDAERIATLVNTSDIEDRNLFDSPSDFYDSIAITLNILDRPSDILIETYLKK